LTYLEEALTVSGNCFSHVSFAEKNISTSEFYFALGFNTLPPDRVYASFDMPGS
jgi:hypothetical protein